MLQNLKRTYGHLAFFEELLLDLQLLGDTSSRRSVTCVLKGSFPSARSIMSQLEKKKHSQTAHRSTSPSGGML